MRGRGRGRGRRQDGDLDSLLLSFFLRCVGCAESSVAFISTLASSAASFMWMLTIARFTSYLPSEYHRNRIDFITYLRHSLHIILVIYIVPKTYSTLTSTPPLLITTLPSAIPKYAATGFCPPFFFPSLAASSPSSPTNSPTDKTPSMSFISRASASTSHFPSSCFDRLLDFPSSTSFVSGGVAS